MAKRYIWNIFPLLAILLLATWFVAYAQAPNNNVAGQDVVQILPAEPLIISGITSVQVSSCHYSSSIPQNSDYIESNPDKELCFRLFVTPEDQSIKALAAQISKPRDAYQMAVQWVYVSDEELNHTTDKWLTPHEFLANTPHYPSNPLPGKEVSDCEEKANALVSLIRAEGIRPEEVRVALGRVKFNNSETGHAWVELLTGDQWVSLDPSWGPYWDGQAGKLIRTRGISFDYYGSHNYPALQVWAYYNDIYYLDPGDGSGNAPASWLKTTLAK